ncbi:MAG: hypothetical protein KKG47_09775 [Proteobacteria bacterium]|nr:hypothetical protein [Pseudomonadota bacterium]MBU1736562.1 hypothetical protein [Pseudomonadota bacterium]
MSSIIKSQTRTQTSSKSAVDSVSRGSIITMGVASGVVGLWAAACLVSAMIGSGGPISLIKSWFSAVGGF